ncbi:hypothetical protein [Dysgonomonas sp. 520]|uniref:hypothetical protein n=1 Tax=Dysgonomonas sp. 520 TaxID=2302931 RepID=UPI0013D05E91|nr:hypothetical protein [Dysgonomonas sp. 520]NDW10981.1 hypothetical protein [Dysgonomonas sp. 520]
MRYKLPTDRLINQLAPHYLPGRKYILFLQSLVYPLYTLNERFIIFAKEKQIEARMTSQVVYFEWYLNRKFKKYLANPDESIYIKDSTSIGVDIYHENAQNGKPFTVWYENETVATVNPLEKPREFYFQTEEKVINKVSFMVCVPEINIPENEFVYMLTYIVNTYKIAGKTYLIKINTKEIERFK